MRLRVSWPFRRTVDLIWKTTEVHPQNHVMHCFLMNWFLLLHILSRKTPEPFSRKAAKAGVSPLVGVFEDEETWMRPSPTESSDVPAENKVWMLLEQAA